MDFRAIIQQSMLVLAGDLGWFIGGVCAGDLLVLHTRWVRVCGVLLSGFLLLAVNRTSTNERVS